MCFFLNFEDFSVRNFTLGEPVDCTAWESCGVHSRNFLLDPIFWQTCFSIFLPLIHFSIIFMCVLLLNPLMPASYTNKVLTWEKVSLRVTLERYSSSKFDFTPHTHMKILVSPGHGAYIAQRLYVMMFIFHCLIEPTCKKHM